MSAAVRSRSRSWMTLGLIAASLTLLVGFWIKDRCTRHDWDGYQYRTSCYNDIYALYFHRGLNVTPERPEPVFPYVDGDGTLQGEDEAGDLEYPVGTGLFVGAIAQIVRDGTTFFRVNALGLAAAGLAAVGLTGSMITRRAPVLYVALAPALALYAFHNWDLLAVAMMVGGLAAFRARADGLAGALIGLGAATKVFPGLIAPALVLARWRERRRIPWTLLGAATAAFVALNLPIMLANFEGWLVPWEFQSTRFPNFETSWYMLYRHLRWIEPSFWWDTFPRLSGLASTFLFAVGAGVLVRAETRRERVRPYALAFGLLIMFLLTSKVFSPQFALWLLPFFALVRMPWQAFAAFALTDAAVWFAISAFFLSHARSDLRLNLVEAAVWARYAVLAWMLWLSRRAEENVADSG